MMKTDVLTHGTDIQGIKQTKKAINGSLIWKGDPLPRWSPDLGSPPVFLPLCYSCLTANGAPVSTGLAAGHATFGELRIIFWPGICTTSSCCFCRVDLTARIA